MNIIKDSKVNLEKNYIQDKIDKKESKFFEDLFDKLNESEIIIVLENIGKIPKDFPYEPFQKLHKYLQNSKIRFLIIKHLGKLINVQSLDFLKKQFKVEEDTLIRREIVSSIGRRRDPNNIKFLVQILEDIDPKIIMQGIRALLYFKENQDVYNSLKKLTKHPNETIREILDVELNKKDNNEEFLKQKQNALKIAPLLKNTVVMGNTYEILKLLPEGCIQLTFTSPPYYNARDYSIYNSYEQYLDFLTRIFKEVHRITEEGRFFILNTSPVLIPRFSRSYASHRFAIPFDIHSKLIEMGFEFIDDIIWKKPDPSAKNRNGGFYQHRKPLAYKPNSTTEYIMVYRKKTHRLLDWNIQQYDEDIIERSKVKEDYEKTNVWKIAPSFAADHSAIFPEELVYWVIKFYSYIGDIILDPFAGSGTVGAVCQKTERHFFLNEINEKYFTHIKKRLANKTLLNISKNNFYNLSQFSSILEKFSSI